MPRSDSIPNITLLPRIPKLYLPTLDLLTLDLLTLDLLITWRKPIVSIGDGKWPVQHLGRHLWRPLSRRWGVSLLATNPPPPVCAWPSALSPVRSN